MNSLDEERTRMSDPESRRVPTWDEIYTGLIEDRNDERAWSGLHARVCLGARNELRDLGPAMVEDAVEDACSSVVVGIARARGVDTFAGFVYGHYLRARKRALRWHRAPVVP